MKNFVKKEVIVARDSRAVEDYMKDVAKYPLLTPAEEVDLAKRSREGDMQARESLILSNLRFVLSVAHSYQGQGLPLEDLISEGNMGLQRAVDQYDESRGFKFCSYAVWWIRQSILQAIGQYSRMLRLPANRQQLLNKVNRTQSELILKFGRMPTTEELAEHLGEEVSAIETVMAVGAGTVSMDKAVAGGEDEAPLSDKMETNLPSPDASLQEESLSMELEDAMSCLTDMQKMVLKKYYGISPYQESSMGEISLQMNLTQERVRQLHRTALDRMRRSSRLDSLRCYL